MTIGQVAWRGLVLGVQPRIDLMRSFDQRSHSYLGYVLLIDGSVGDEQRHPSAGAGSVSHLRHDGPQGRRRNCGLDFRDEIDLCPVFDHAEPCVRLVPTCASRLLAREHLEAKQLHGLDGTFQDSGFVHLFLAFMFCEHDWIMNENGRMFKYQPCSLILNNDQ